MATERDTEVAASDYLNMSDEDISKVDIGAVSLQASKAPVDAEAEAEEEDTPPDDSVGEIPDADVDEDPEDTDDGSEDESADEPVVDKTPVDKAKPKEATTNAEVTKDETAPPVDGEIDYKAAYERLVAPFKANGKDIAVGNVDDAIALMQMGANYNKKMAALKPSLKVLKLLENNGLLSEDKLSYLIDLDKKNPEAITKLLKDSGLDPLDLSTDKAADYKPQKYSVDDVEIELDTVLDELQETPTYTKMLDVVSNKWDGPSKQIVANSPQILRVINSHMQSGIYDLIHTEMESERVYGRLNGLSDIEAYRKVGDAIQARGGFDHLGHQGQQAPKAPVVVTPKPKPADDSKLKDKRRAASSSKPAAPASTPSDFNPLGLSDEEFSKQINGKYL